MSFFTYKIVMLHDPERWELQAFHPNLAPNGTTVAKGMWTATGGTLISGQGRAVAAGLGIPFSDSNTRQPAIQGK